MKNETNAYGEWVEAFKDSMMVDIEPVSLVDFNVKTVLDYAQELGFPRHEAERDLRPWILEGYKRAHARAVLKLQIAVETGDPHRMAQILSDLIASGEKIGISGKEIEERHRRDIARGYERCRERERQSELFEAVEI